MVVKAKYFGLLGVVAMVLAACSEQEAGADYFDSINPDPSILQPRVNSPQPLPSEQSSTIETVIVYGEPDVEPRIPDAEGQIAADAGEALEPANAPTSTKPAAGLYEPSLDAPTLEDEPTRETKAPDEDVTTVVEQVKPRKSGIDLAAYARSQTHLVGEKKYRRSSKGYGQASRCHTYTVPEVAQVVFLENGGPKSDDLKMDPDGDGFACGWTPYSLR